MKGDHIISKADALRPNGIDAGAKYHEVAMLETEVFDFLLKDRLSAEERSALISRRDALMEAAEGDDLASFMGANSFELLLPAAYHMAYVYHVMAFIDSANGDYALYNNDAALSESILKKFKKTHRRGHFPSGEARWRLI